MEARSQRRMMENKPQTEKTMRVARLRNKLSWKQAQLDNYDGVSPVNNCSNEEEEAE